MPSRGGSKEQPVTPAQARLREAVEGLRELRLQLETRRLPGSHPPRPRLTLVEGGRVDA